MANINEFGLNPRQRRFVQEYVKDCNGTQAAIRAGYSENGADVQGSRLLGNVNVVQAIECFQRKLEDAGIVSIEEIVGNLRNLEKLAIDDKQYSVAARCVELRGKTIGAFVDKSLVAVDSIDWQEFANFTKDLVPKQLNPPETEPNPPI